MTDKTTAIILVSADAEWASVKEYYSGAIHQHDTFGEFFLTEIKGQTVVFQQGGWGKIGAAASAAYAIQRWESELVLNLGTCGGFAGKIDRGVILMPDKTLSYDIIEQMSDPQEAIEHYTTHLDHDWLKPPFPFEVQGGVMVSADRDIVPTDISSLIKAYNARAADWESASIAWVTVKKFKKRCLILRGVSDLVSETGGEAYEGIEFFAQASRKIMVKLCESLPVWLTCAGY